MQGDPYVFPFIGGIGSPFMATLNPPDLNMGMSVLFFYTSNFLNDHYYYQVGTIFQENQNPFPSSSMTSYPPLSILSRESLNTSN